MTLRPWRRGDVDALVHHGDDRAVWRNMTNRFPSPYTRRDAREWIAFTEALPPPTRHFAVVVDGAPVGGAGVEPHQDLRTRTAELGYWLGREVWGRGLATEAARLLADHAFAAWPDLVRLEAGVIAWNPASCRVLEKAGFVLESRELRSVWKDGQIADRLVFRRLRAP